MNDIEQVLIFSGLSQGQIGRSFGISQQAVSKLLLGKMRPSTPIRMLARLLVWLGEVDPSLVTMAFSHEVPDPHKRALKFFGTHNTGLSVYFRRSFAVNDQSPYIRRLAATLDLLDLFAPARAKDLKHKYSAYIGRILMVNSALNELN